MKESLSDVGKTDIFVGRTRDLISGFFVKVDFLRCCFDTTLVFNILINKALCLV